MDVFLQGVEVLASVAAVRASEQHRVNSTVTKWTAGPPLATARSDFGLAAVGSTLYAVGGWKHGSVFASVEVLNTSAP